jgi:hypothetical protein
VRLTNLSVSLPSLVQSLSSVDIIKCSTMYPSCLSVITWPAATISHSHNMVSHEMIA